MSNPMRYPVSEVGLDAATLAALPHPTLMPGAAHGGAAHGGGAPESDPDAARAAIGELDSFIRHHWAALRDACRRDGRDRARFERLAALVRDASLKADADALVASARDVAELQQGLADVSKTIDGRLAILADIKAGLDLLAKVVKVAAQVAGLATGR